ncbi:MAG: site-specific integrase [Sandaracinaceae bacterium]|nr:site-specific integrase [Sandaracinaceae bacterium]
MREVDREVEARSASDAARLRTELRAEAHAAPAQAERPRLASFARSWLEARTTEVKASTAEFYALMLDLHIIPHFGEHYLDSITETDIARWRDAMSGAPASRNGRLRALRTLLEAAVPRFLSYNPASRVRPARAVRIDRSPNRLTANELRDVLEHLRAQHERSLAALERACEERPGPRDRVPMAYPMVLALVSTGARWGEMSALRFGDIDEAAGVIHIRRAHWKGIVDTTKTGTVRTVPLTPELSRVLREHRRLLVATQHPGLSSGLVFPSATGEHRRPKSIDKPFAAALAKAGIERRQTIHGLRRTFNDLLRQVASGEVVRSMTGHSTVEMTEHYSHVGAAEKAGAVARALGDIARGGDTGGDSNDEGAGALAPTPVIVP